MHLTRKLLPKFLFFLAGGCIILFAFIAYQKLYNQKSNSLSSWVSQTKEECSLYSQREPLDRCYRKFLKLAVKQQGVTFSIGLLEELRKKGVIKAEFDDHQHAHEIGRAAAEILGIHIQAFLACPSTFNYGCQHGFFEYALSKSDTYSQAATSICENIPKEKPTKLYSYCYHGVGHGLMMAMAYKLNESLTVCDQLPTINAQEGCWQGVFMENMNAIVEDKKAVGFDPQDPLAPCNKMEKKYQWQCYINHAGYLTKLTKLDVRKAADICLSTQDENVHPCIQSIGLMTTNPIWQKSIYGIDTANNLEKNAETAWTICRKMPTTAYSDCMVGAVANILNFDELNTQRSFYFCSIVPKQYQDLCFVEIGRILVSLTTNSNIAKEKCENLTDVLHRSSCLAGFSLASNKGFPPLSIPPEQENQLITNDIFLKQSIQQFGPSQIIYKLSTRMPEQNLSCHDRAHETGRYAYELFESQAFKLCSSECHSGCYHGATEAFFNDKGTDQLEKNMSLLCSSDSNRFFKHQCVHGIGHGLMAWTSYELFEALSNCDLLRAYNDQWSCWSGVFMENIVGGLADKSSGHFTKYLNADPHFPCNSVPEKYKGACYFLQTSRMRQLFNNDFQKIAEACENAPSLYKTQCFQSMGRDASGTTQQNITYSIQYCQFAPEGELRTNCLEGAVQDTFWDPSGEEKAKKFCSLLKKLSEKKHCYDAIITRAKEILNASAYSSFCYDLPQDKLLQCNNASSYLKPSLTPIKSPIQATPTQTQRETKETKVIIRITEDGYNPNKITVKEGTLVVFKNVGTSLRWPASNIHPMHLIYPEFDSKKPLENNQQWKFIFNKKGVWRFHDHLNPELTGIITVK